MVSIHKVTPTPPATTPPTPTPTPPPLTNLDSQITHLLVGAAAGGSLLFILGCLVGYCGYCLTKSARPKRRRSTSELLDRTGAPGDEAEPADDADTKAWLARSHRLRATSCKSSAASAVGSAVGSSSVGSDGLTLVTSSQAATQAARRIEMLAKAATAGNPLAQKRLSALGGEAQPESNV